MYYPWTGFYIGGNIGGGFANTDFSGTTSGTMLKGVPFQETFNASRSQHGWLGGGQVGINYEIVPRLVVGVEGDIDWSNIKGSVSACSSKTAAGVIDCSTSAGKISRLWHGPRTPRLRVRQSARVWDRRVCLAHETATVTETCNGTKCPKTSNVFAINSASYSAKRPTVGRPGPDLSGASFRIGRFGSNTSICNSTAYPTRSTSMGRSKGFPLLRHPMSRQTLVSKSCASA